MKDIEGTYCVYLLRCADGTLYCGITTDVKRRVEEHNSSDRGAKYTRGRRPVELVHASAHADRSAAMREEYRIKRLTREEKMRLVAEGNI